jgi:hypothetical protein
MGATTAAATNAHSDGVRLSRYVIAVADVVAPLVVFCITLVE